MIAVTQWCQEQVADPSTHLVVIFATEVERHTVVYGAWSVSKQMFC